MEAGWAVLVLLHSHQPWRQRGVQRCPTALPALGTPQQGPSPNPGCTCLSAELTP